MADPTRKQRKVLNFYNFQIDSHKENYFLLMIFILIFRVDSYKGKYLMLMIFTVDGFKGKYLMLMIFRVDSYKGKDFRLIPSKGI